MADPPTSDLAASDGVDDLLAVEDVEVPRAGAPKPPPTGSAPIAPRAPSAPPPIPGSRHPTPMQGSKFPKPPPPLPKGRVTKVPPMQTTVSLRTPLGVVPLKTPGVPVIVRTRLSELVDALVARKSALAAKSDKIGIARVELEIALAEEVLGDGSRATLHAHAALKIDPDLTAAHALLRRTQHGRSSAKVLLEHLGSEISACSDGSRADLIAERGRLLEAAGEKPEAIRVAWEDALAAAPEHPAALKGIEAVRMAAKGGTKAYEEHAAHLARMAVAYASEPKLAAWLHVERAQILDRKLGQTDGAWEALSRALVIDSGVGPVRNACIRHAAIHQDAASLVTLLEDEAGIEPNGARSAWLELDAACIAAARLDDVPRATRLLERAATRTQMLPATERRILDELVRIHEGAGRPADALRARRARLKFFATPLPESHEHRALATLSEQLGDTEGAIREIERARALDPSDEALLAWADRLLAAAGKQDARATLWADESARSTDDEKRTYALVRAAEICESLGRTADAIAHLRAAWVTSPESAEVFDPLTRLLTAAPSEPASGDVRARIALYAHAADRTKDPARKVAYLEKVALLWEEVMGESELAGKAYEAVLTIDPHRRGALLGLERTAARAKNPRAVSRALLDEARDAGDQATKLELTTRAAEVLAGVDADRALALVEDVLKASPSQAQARKLESQLHEAAGRWELAGRALSARIGQAKDDKEKLALWLAQADVQKTRLNLPREALASLKAARKLDSKHPVPPEAIARVLESLGDHEGLRAALEELATDATTPTERARHLVRAAEIDELRLSDDAGAASLYGRALAETPDDELIVERLVRVLARIAPAMALATLLPAGVDAPSTTLGRAGAFERAMLLLGAGTDVAQATALVESVLAQDPNHVPALRTLEGIARATCSLPLLANTLCQEAAAFSSPIAKLGALWGVAALVEWQLPESTDAAVYQRILELAPGDRAALDASLRRALVHTRMADSSGRALAVSALRGLLRHASDDTGILAIHLQLGTLLEREGDPTDPGAADAIEHYRAALRIDPLSVTAASGAARLATQLRDAEAGLVAAVALADLATDPKVRARHLLEAADLLLTAQEPRLGEPKGRRLRAAEMLEQALEADPESIPAAGRLGTLRAEEHQNDRLVAAFRSAIRRAQAPDAIVMLGGEIARIARDELHDLTIAIDAMRRVREVAPRHIPSLLTLAELYIAHRGWREAIEVLETVVSTSRETPQKLTALFGLASLYERVVAQPADVERVLRAALDLEPTGPRALRALIRHLRTTEASAPGAVREQLAGLLERLVDAEPTAEAKQAILMEVFDLRTSMEDRAGAERALIEAAAQAPNANVLARLTAFHEGDQTSQARALAAVVSRGQKLGRVDAGWLAALGELEVESMGRSQEGISHLRQAVQLDPTLFESRFHLSRALARIGGNEEAAGTLLPMITPDPHPFLALKDQGAGLELLERVLSSSRRGEEAIAVRELRDLAGGLDDGAHVWLRSRRLPYDPSSVEGLDRATLVKRALPPEGRHVLLEVAAAASGMEGKIFRANLSELGISARERIGARSGHPFRAQLDRVMRILALEEVELAISDTVSFARVFIQDVPWLVVPPALTGQPEPLQLAAIARALTRVALRVPWIEDLPPPHVHAYLVAVGRQVVPDFASEAEDRYVAELVASYQPRVAHAIGRKQRKLLADLSPQLESARITAQEIEELVHAVARAESRVAFLASGELLSTFDELRALDAVFARTSSTRDTRALAAVLTHPLAGDVARFAMSPEATALRWRIGTVWGAAKS